MRRVGGKHGPCKGQHCNRRRQPAAATDANIEAEARVGDGDCRVGALEGLRKGAPSLVRRIALESGPRHREGGVAAQAVEAAAEREHVGRDVAGKVGLGNGERERRGRLEAQRGEAAAAKRGRVRAQARARDGRGARQRAEDSDRAPAAKRNAARDCDGCEGGVVAVAKGDGAAAAAARRGHD